jgi:hypothetical protein
VRDGEVFNFTPTLETVTAAGQPRKSGFLNRMFGGGIPEGKGLLILRTKPQGATVFLNGKQTPALTPLRNPVDPGRYRVMLRMQGYKVVFRELAVEKDMVTEITVELEKAGKN